jgi:hypothetical protein
MTTLRPSSLNQLSDEQLVAEMKRLAHCERGVTAELIAHLAELDSRRLYLGLGFASLFVYCTGALRLSEHEAYNRIEAARAARRFPPVLDLLREGKLNLTTIRLLAPHLTGGNHEDLLASAYGRSRREVEELLAERFPRPPVPSSIRKVSAAHFEPATSRSSIAPSVPTASAIADAQDGSPPPIVLAPAQANHPSPARRAALVPLASDLYKFTFTAKSDTRQKLQRAQDLLRHQIPNGDVAEIFDRALSSLLEDLERKKLAATDRPRQSRGADPGSRHIPAEVRRAVWRRDGGRCGFVAKDGRRCHEHGFLEFHHARPFAAGGAPSSANIALRCRSHNRYEAELYFAPTRFIALERIPTPSGTSSTAPPGPQP